MMNIAAAKDDVQIAIRRLPKDFILEVAGAFSRHKDAVMAAFPKMQQDLGGHLAALALDWGAGTIDVEGIEKAGKELLADFISVDLDTSSRPDPDDAENGYVPESK